VAISLTIFGHPLDFQALAVNSWLALDLFDWFISSSH
jgi:hypothetical protein